MWWYTDNRLFLSFLPQDLLGTIYPESGSHGSSVVGSSTSMVLANILSFLNIVFFQTGEALEKAGADRASVPFYQYLADMVRQRFIIYFKIHK